MPSATPDPAISHDDLQAILDADLAAGQHDRVRQAAADMIRRGDLDADRKAALSLRLGACDLAAGHVLRAYEMATRALEDVGRAEDEVEALVLRARCTALLGRELDAVDDALLAVHLAQGMAGLPAARAQTALGLAWGWARQFASANQAFETATRLLDGQDAETARRELQRDRAWINAYRATWAGLSGDPDADYTKWLDSVTGVIDGAQPELVVTSAWRAAVDALRANDLNGARRHVQALEVAAQDLGHEPLVDLATCWLGHLDRSQGRVTEALAASQRMLERQRRRQAEALGRRLASCAESARRHDLARYTSSLEEERRRYESWAMEDALTGLANLRRFDQALSAWSQQATEPRPPTCVALIDVDRFKQINDSHSHATGDRVLKLIGATLAAHTRANDLAARWGGDEFAILFHDTEEAAAWQIAERIERGVREHDWSGVAPGLQVSISIGVVQAEPGDGKSTLVDRSDRVMYERKRSRDRRALERLVPRPVAVAVARWLRDARHVVILVGGDVGDGQSAESDGSSAWSSEERERHAHVTGWQRDPEGFLAHWNSWRRERLSHRTVTEAHRRLVQLARQLPSVCMVTERIDGVLALAGAEDVIELYGNAFRDRCDACGALRPNRSKGRCMACNTPRTTIRPDIVLLGEQPDRRLMAGAELSAKRADLVLIVDSDAAIHPTSALIDKARSRQARIVQFGGGSRPQCGSVDVAFRLDTAVALSVLTDMMGMRDPIDSPALSPDGLRAMCFLTGQATDDRGLTIDGALDGSDLDLARRLAVLPWLFPLLTRSRLNPDAPVPTPGDFAAITRDPLATHGQRRAFDRLLSFYGFAWAGEAVERATHWRDGFALWARRPSEHDLLLSRLLGSTRLCGLERESRALLSALETEMRRQPRVGADLALRHWRMAGHGETTTAPGDR